MRQVTIFGVSLTAITVMLAVAPASVLAQTAGAPQQPLKLEDVVVTGDAAKQVYDRNVLRLDVAEKIAKACFAYAVRNDFAVALHIIDQFGYSIYAGRMDGRKADNIETAEMKARTALYFREPTRVWMERSRQDALMPHLLHQMGQFPVAGGLPIIVEDQLVGAIGVGGGSSDQDEECARAGLLEVLGPQPALAASGSR